jgi:hypothetical protein
VVYGRNKMNPKRTEARGQHRYGHNEALSESQDSCHQLDEVAISNDVRATDVQRAAESLRCPKASDKIVQCIADRNRL